MSHEPPLLPTAAANTKVGWLICRVLVFLAIFSGTALSAWQLGTLYQDDLGDLVQRPGRTTALQHEDLPEQAVPPNTSPPADLPEESMRTPTYTTQLPVCNPFQLPGYLGHENEPKWHPLFLEEGRGGSDVVVGALGARCRTVLFVGDSFDRIFIDGTCRLAHSTPLQNRSLDYKPLDTKLEGQPHICHLTAHNATILNLFHFGVNERPIPNFLRHRLPTEPWRAENRIKLMKRFMRMSGVAEPDFIVVHSGYWDAKAKYLSTGSPANYTFEGEDVALWMHRVRRKLLSPVRSVWPRAHLAWRTAPAASATYRWLPNSALATRNLNQAARVMMLAERVEVLDWAETVADRWDMVAGDGIHQNDLGCKVLLRMLLEKMERDFGDGGKRLRGDIV
ncbi:hypothetical protein BDK51DRAFT_25494 [Blyttiomyces helicus]|uniref:Uncharacterized protein n=1 Tax=Blyttiomyces helicus TaxID=388810 RepID=A0A4P9WHF1_9FUNG|nr:hypothetical protein BDK51DRAFT_25494 [Blyttiomyces helicus]|eukprot:RKO90510.1 hypothetical protein BDK51DRAFT_25494 [Blyttiomyces helicus]